MKRFISAFAVAALVMASGITNAAKPVTPPSAPAKLEAGCVAPPLKVFKWLKGKPVTKFQKGKIYVVEFWATWCPPCRTSIPHITELAKKYAGKITFIGVSIWDSVDRATRKPYTKEQYIDIVTKFVKEQGDKMDYTVAMDDLKGTIAETWAKAAQIPGIPSAFVIGKDGKIAVIIHPMSLDDILGQIVDGKFDSKAFIKEQNDKDAKEKAEQEAFQKAFAKVEELEKQQKYKEAIEEVDKVIAANPQYEPQAAFGRFDMLLKIDEAAAYVYIRKCSEGLYKDNSQALYAIADMVLNNQELKSPDYDTVIEIAEKASNLVNNEDPFILDSLAAANFRKGNIDKAIEIQEKAVKLIESDAQIPDRYKQNMKANLTEYKIKKDRK